MMRLSARRGSTGAIAADAPPPPRGDEHWHDLLAAALDLAGSPTDLRDAVGRVLDFVLAYSHWPLAHALLFSDDTGASPALRVWQTVDPTRFADFAVETDGMRFAAGQGLPGRVLATGRPVWVPDVARDTNFPRQAIAAACGIRGAVGVPVRGRNGVSGVIEAFAETPTEVDEPTLAVMQHLADHLAATAERMLTVESREEAEQALRRSERDLAEAQRIAHIGSWTWDVGADHLSWSAELLRIYGLSHSPGPVVFEDYLARVHPEDRARVSQAVRRAVDDGERYEQEYRIVRTDGSVRWVRAAGEVTERRDGRASRLGGFCHDITDQHRADTRRRQAQEALASQQQLLQRVARGEPLTGTLDALCRDVEERCPGAKCSVLTVAPAENVLRHAAAPSLPESFRRAVDGMAINDSAGACGRAASRLEDVVVADTLNDTLTAEFVALARHHQLRSVWSHPLTTAGGELLGTFALYRHERHTPDPTEREAVSAAGSIAAVAIERALAVDALTAAAQRDPLTGLANRAAFLDRLTEALARTGHRTSVLFCDLDRFKWINDSIGHPAGDTILVEVGWRLESALAGDHLLARFGGDEFTVLVTDATPSELDALADRIKAVVEAPFRLEGGEFFLSVSIGIATAAAAVDASELLRDADAAMYAAKERGPGRHAVFDSRLRERAVERVTVENDLRRAIERDELTMQYQPIVDPRTGDWAGVEALVCWRHADRGLVPPDRFVPLAEETGLILPLGARVTAHVLTDVSGLCTDRGIYVAINVSAVQLADPAFATDLLAQLDRHGMAASQLVLEVTETALMLEPETARTTLGELVELGARVFVDDFGTGYSSIARLRELPVAGVKIDRRFSAAAGADDAADRLLAAINDLAHAVGLQVVAEGIETAAAATRVRELGCDFAQGYHFARPVPVAQLSP
jgi:c-di-GMP-specific phosphodiesterase